MKLFVTTALTFCIFKFNSYVREAEGFKDLRSAHEQKQIVSNMYFLD